MSIEEYNTLVGSNELTIVKAGTTWCQPCKVLAGTIVKLEKELSDVKFIEIDAEDEPEVSTYLRIKNVPVLLYYKNGELKDKSVGLVSEDAIKEKIEGLKQ